MNIVALLHKSKVQVVLCLGICTFLMSLFCNIDSYLYMQIGQFDSAVFFMCGKSLMNGMIPYEDFTDSKGILLWLFYGIGYLIDHYSYVGIFWMMCGIVFITLCIAYRTSRLFLDRNASVLAALMTLIPLMYWNFYFETKSEHFCWPAVAWGIYVLMKALKGNDLKSVDYASIGASIVYCLFIKWSVAVMMLCFVVSLGWIAWQRKEICRYFIGSLCGLIGTFLPFVVYFSICGNLRDMWQEYFVNTLTTVSKPMDETVVDIIEGGKNLFTTKNFLYLVYTLPVLSLWKRERWFTSSLPALCGLFFIALCVRAGDGVHYITIAGPFAIMTIVVVLRWLISLRISLRYLSLLFVVSASYVIWGHIHYSNNFCTKNTAEFNRYMALSWAMSQVSEHPSVIILGMEPGLCMGTALPGTKYWTLQKGRTEQMWQDELAAIRDGSADFIVLWCADVNEYDRMLTDCGYHFLSDYYAGSVYTRHDLKIPEIKEVTVCDIISKRTYADLYGK